MSGNYKSLEEELCSNVNDLVSYLSESSAPLYCSYKSLEEELGINVNDLISYLIELSALCLATTSL